MFAGVRSVLRNCDVGFCQLEPVLTERGEPLPQARLAMRAPPQSAFALRDAGFHVVSCAGNHCMDFGAVGLRDTLDALQSAGLHAIGVGKDIVSARRPTIVDANGVQVAFLAYSSILPMNYWAGEHRPGCAPLRAWTQYEQIEHDRPGTPARVHTFAHGDDLAAVCDDVREARKHADHVIVSMHWGVHFVPGELAAYQREMAYAAVDAGASMIVGHHPHVLKAVEVYRGKPIFYSLGNFALDPPGAFAPDVRQSKGFRDIEKLARGWDATNMLPPDSYHSLLVRCRLSETSVDSVELLPVHINADCEPTLPTADDPAFAKIVEYLNWACTSQGLPIPYAQQKNQLNVRR